MCILRHYKNTLYCSYQKKVFRKTVIVAIHFKRIKKTTVIAVEQKYF